MNISWTKINIHNMKQVKKTKKNKNRQTKSSRQRRRENNLALIDTLNWVKPNKPLADFPVYTIDLTPFTETFFATCLSGLIVYPFSL